MNVNFNNVGFYNYGFSPVNRSQSFKAVPSLNLMQKNGINAQEYQNKCNNARSYDELDAIKSEYYNKAMSVVFDENGKLDKRIVDYLENTEFPYTDGSNKTVKIKDLMKDSIYRTRHIDFPMYHATSSEETANNIIKNGFDPKRISRTLVGPGFYFSPSRDCTLMYNNHVLKAQIEGTCADVNSEKIQEIDKLDIQKHLRNFIGLEGTDYNIGVCDGQIMSKVIDEYVRTSFYEDLGIDVVDGNGGGVQCYAVYNPNSIHNIENDGSSPSISWYY